MQIVSRLGFRAPRLSSWAAAPDHLTTCDIHSCTSPSLELYITSTIARPRMLPSAVARAGCVQGFPEKAKSKLDDYGFIQSRPKGEIHANNQQMSKLLHKAIGLGGKGKAPQVCAISPCTYMSCHIGTPACHSQQESSRERACCAICQAAILCMDMIFTCRLLCPAVTHTQHMYMYMYVVL